MAQMLIRVTKEMDDALKNLDDDYFDTIYDDGQRTIIEGVYKQWKDADEITQ